MKPANIEATRQNTRKSHPMFRGKQNKKIEMASDYIKSTQIGLYFTKKDFESCP